MNDKELNTDVNRIFSEGLYRDNELLKFVYAADMQNVKPKDLIIEFIKWHKDHIPIVLSKNALELIVKK